MVCVFGYTFLLPSMLCKTFTSIFFYLLLLFLFFPKLPQKFCSPTNWNWKNTRDIPEDVLNTYCWIHSTYTVVDAFLRKQGSEVPFPGVDNSHGHARGGSVTVKHTKYYQWVAFTLFFQVSEIFF